MQRNHLAHRFCVAPMMDWTDRHDRYFLRLISRRARLYTEMVTTGALLHGDVERHLGFDPAESPVALQLGGSEPEDLARSARLGEQWGYDEINLNCGCPSPRVQRGAFGACLMKEPALVADCVRAMGEAVSIPVTVKCRIGVDDSEEYGFLRDFVDAIAEAGCRTVIVHARKAWLQGLSPKENREVPPLRYGVVHRLRQDRPDLCIVTNGGLKTLADAQRELTRVDGVMFGREAYQNPWLLASVDEQLFGDARRPITRESVLEAFLPYVERELARGVRLKHMTRHILGLYRGLPGGKQFRRVLSDGADRPGAGPELIRRALACVAPEDAGAGCGAAPPSTAAAG